MTVTMRSPSFHPIPLHFRHRSEPRRNQGSVEDAVAMQRSILGPRFDPNRLKGIRGRYVQKRQRNRRLHQEE